MSSLLQLLISKKKNKKPCSRYGLGLFDEFEEILYWIITNLLNETYHYSRLQYNYKSDKIAKPFYKN